MSKAPVRRWRVWPAEWREVDEDVGAFGGGEDEALSSTGAARRPWSLPIWVSGWPFERARLKKRLLAVLRRRKR